MILALLISALTLDEAVERALRNHPETSVARANLTVASAQISAAGALPAPQFRYSTNNFDVDPLTLRERTTIAMRYSPPRPWEMVAKKQIAQTRQRSASAELRGAEARVSAEVRLAFRRAVLAEQRATLAQRVLDLRRNRRNTIVRQVSAGVKEADERDLADLSVDEAESELRRARSLSESERRNLARLVEPGGASDLALVVELDVLSEPASPAGLLELTTQAIERRADLDALDATCRQVELTEKLANKDRYPWVSFVQVSHRITAYPERGPWGWQIGVNLPFFRSESAAAAKVAAAQKERCRIQYRAMQNGIGSEVESGAENLEQIRRELIELERLRSGPGQRALERTRVALANGRADLTEVLDAEARLLTLQDRWLEKKGQYIVVEAHLEATIGAALPLHIATRTAD